jgi:hypothetical protein
MYGFVMAVREDSDGAIRLRRFESGLLHGRSMWHAVDQHVGGFFLQQRTCTFPSVRAPAALLLSYSHQVLGISVMVQVVLKSRLGTFLSLAKVYTFLLWMMDLVVLATVALDMRRSLLPLKSTMVTLCNGAAFLGHQGKLSVSVVAATDSMAFQT